MNWIWQTGQVGCIFIRPAPPSRPDKNTPHLPKLPNPIHKPPFLAGQHFLKAGL